MVVVDRFLRCTFHQLTTSHTGSVGQAGVAICLQKRTMGQPSQRREHLGALQYLFSIFRNRVRCLNQANYPPCRRARSCTLKGTRSYLRSTIYWLVDKCRYPEVSGGNISHRLWSIDVAKRLVSTASHPLTRMVPKQPSIEEHDKQPRKSHRDLGITCGPCVYGS